MAEQSEREMRGGVTTYDLAAHAEVIVGDDSYTRCLEMEAEAKRGFSKKSDERDPLINLLEAKIGRVFAYKNNLTKSKQGLFVSHVHGRTDIHDPRSTIYIFRTHFGHCGNLLSKMLAMRPNSAGKVVIQSDLASSNLPEPLLIKRWVSRLVGCSAHARRPFARHKEDDFRLSDRMLELFALLSAIEKKIDRLGRTPDRTVRIRQRLGRPVWKEIQKLAQSVVDAENEKSAKDRPHFLWPKKSPLYVGAKYIVKHYPKLTAYIDDWRMAMSNNAAERQLRGEKILLVSCKFRKSELGRISIDILRSLIMTATAAEVSPRAYLTWALSQPEEDINKKPHLYTPLAYRRQLSAASSLQAKAS